MRLAPGAWRIAAVPLVLAALALLVHAALAAGLLLLTGAVLAFYRDPDRTAPDEPGLLSPADGRVSVLREEGDALRVGVFMGPWNVHVNRAPAGGTVETVEHTPGAHRPAFSKDSDRNERLTVSLEGLEVVLVAGAFARRIAPYVEPGETVQRGQRVGHIAFGSRADVVVPGATAADAAVEAGDRVRAGETVLVRD